MSRDDYGSFISTYYRSEEGDIIAARSVPDDRSGRRRRPDEDRRRARAGRRARTSRSASAASTAATRPACMFCHKIGLDYVSLQPVPRADRAPGGGSGGAGEIARLATAHLNFSIGQRLRRAAASSVHHAYLLILLSAFSFAVMTACGHAIGERADWRITAVVRALVFLFTLLIAARRGTALVVWGPTTLWVRSIAGSISMLLTFYAMARLPVGTLLTLTNTFPLWVTLIAWPVLGHRPTALFTIAIISGILGVVLIEGPQNTGIRPASAAALLASLCTAVVMIGLHRLRTVESLAIVVHFSAVATLVCFTYSVVTAATLEPIDLTALLDPTTIRLLLGVGVCGTVGQVCMTRAFGLGRPQNLSVVFLSQVVFALGFDWAIWGRNMTLITLAGTVLILAPVAWLLTKQTPSTLTEK